MTPWAGRRILSAHQSFRSEKTLNDIRSHPNPLLALNAFLLLQEKNNSLKSINRLQRRLRRKLPVVVYPNSQTEDELKNYDFKRVTVQPTPELLRAWNIESSEDIDRSLEQHGIDGFCWDTHHIRNGGNNSYSPWQQSPSSSYLDRRPQENY